MYLAAICAVVVTLLPASVRADATDSCDALRGRLALEHRRAARWNYGWGFGLAGLAVAQGITAAINTDHAQNVTLYVGAASAAFGAVSGLVLPLRVVAPAESATCAELAQQVLVDGQAERAGFYLNHAGGLAVNAAAALAVAHYTDWAHAGAAFGVGYAVALVRTYTMPRWAWHPTIAVDRTTAVAGIAAEF